MARKLLSNAQAIAEQSEFEGQNLDFFAGDQTAAKLSTIRHGSREPGSEMVENHEEVLDVRFRRQVIDEHPE